MNWFFLLFFRKKKQVEKFEIPELRTTFKNPPKNVSLADEDNFEEKERLKRLHKLKVEQKRNRQKEEYRRRRDRDSSADTDSVLPGFIMPDVWNDNQPLTENPHSNEFGGGDFGGGGSGGSWDSNSGSNDSGGGDSGGDSGGDFDGGSD